MKLVVTSNTVFKQTTVPSTELPDTEKINVQAGSEFEVQSYLEIEKHVKFTLMNDSLAGRKTWIAYKNHLELIGDDGLKIIGEYKTGDKLPEKVNLQVPWFSQLDNRFKPMGTCNVTSVAMCLYYYNIRSQNPNQQLEDELFQFVERKGWDRHVHEHLRRLFIEYGVFDEFTMDATWDEVKLHLANKQPVIISGKFTEAGHILVLRGYDATGFWVNDPYGEFFHSGYRTDLTGENLHYSYNLVQSKSYAGTDWTWAHFPEKR
ncbi:MAG: C39 family peptidase [Scytonema sp. PMC 1070.18]|nr:C39 family peptidase [Scytonema sp. PMC 1070.18]